MLRQIKVEGEDFNCLNRKGANGDPTGPTYCLEPQTSILRYTEYPSGTERAIRRKIVSFQGHYFAEDLQTYYTLGNKGSLILHLENIEVLDPIDEAVFTPPPSAVPQSNSSITIAKIPSAGNGVLVDSLSSVPKDASDSSTGMKRITVSGGIMAGKLLKKVVPIYPPGARAMGVEGGIVLLATIGKDGHISNLRVISGPEMLQKAAIDAVKQWVYQPYLLNGEPVEVQTVLSVGFQLNH
jgi:TonB family protein